MKARGTWMGGSHILLEDRRGHQVTVDLPHGEGGGDLGTSAVELTVLSLAGSILTVFAQVAKKRRLAFQSLRVDLDADQPEKAPSVAAVEGVLHVVTSAPPEDVASALGFTLLTCLAGVLFEQARIPVRVHSEVHPAHRVDPAARPHPAGEPRPGAKHLGDSPPPRSWRAYGAESLGPRGGGRGARESRASRGSRPGRAMGPGPRRPRSDGGRCRRGDGVLCTSCSPPGRT